MFTIIAFITLPVALTTLLVSLLGPGGAYILSDHAKSHRRAKKAAGKVFKERAQSRRFLDGFKKNILKASKGFRKFRGRQQLSEQKSHSLKETKSLKAKLEGAGILDLQQLSELAPETIAEELSVSEQKAHAILDAIKVQAEVLQDKPIPPPRADLSEPGAEKLVAPTLQMVGALQELHGTPGQLEHHATELENGLAEVKKLTSFWQWLRYGKNNPKFIEAIKQAQQLEQKAIAIEESGFLEEAANRRAAAKEHSRKKFSKSELSEEYRKNYASCVSAIDSAANDHKDALRELLGRGLSASMGSSDSFEDSLALDDATLAAIESTLLHSGGLNVVLRRYQVFGAKFLLAQQRTILGDEMGLGKTMQTLAVMAQLTSKKPKALFVVVAPASLLCNWVHEVKNHAFFPSYLAHGASKKQATEIWTELGGLLVISYATLRTFELSEILENKNQQIDFLVADEAHFIKNPDSQRSQAVAQLATQSERVCYMSGTPMENHPREFARLIRQLGPNNGFTLEDEDLQHAHHSSISQEFRQEIAGIYLRRNQEDVLLELPPKIEVDEWVQLTSEESEMYNEAVQSSNFMWMRQAVTLSPDHDQATRKQVPSSKMRRLLEILEEYQQNGRKVIIFSYFLKVLRDLSSRLNNVGLISGGVSLQEREDMLTRLREEDGHQILLAQVTAAGQGLNIQAASVVIFMEPQLTPGSEAQAIARAHRMGQTQRVMVHKLLAEDTVDNRIVQILDEKSKLFDQYARVSLSKELNPESTETALAQKIVELEKERLQLRTSE